MRTARGFLLTGILLIAAIAAAQTAGHLANVNGEVITDADVLRVAGGQLRQLEQLRPPIEADYEREKLAIRWKALHYLIERKLVRAEAVKEMLTEDDLMRREVDGKMERITPEFVEAFYEANRIRMPLTERLSRREALSQVRAYMLEQSWNSERDAFVDRLMKQYEVTTYLEPLRMSVATAGHPTRGSGAAPVTIVEFSDFECVDCAEMSATLASVHAEYQDKVRIVYRQFPLAYRNKNAQKAAEASLCADDQQRFWDFHDVLYKNQHDLTAEGLKRTAQSLKLDDASFAACLDSGKHIGDVNKHIDEAYAAGVKGSPTIFINGRKLARNRSGSDIRKIIDEELKRF